MKSALCAAPAKAQQRGTRSPDGLDRKAVTSKYLLLEASRANLMALSLSFQQHGHRQWQSFFPLSLYVLVNSATLWHVKMALDTNPYYATPD